MTGPLLALRVIAAVADATRSYATAGPVTVANRAGIDEDTARLALSVLREAGMIEADVGPGAKWIAATRVTRRGRDWARSHVLPLGAIFIARESRPATSQARAELRQ